MAVAPTTGHVHPLPRHANVAETTAAYTIELDVSDFTSTELSVEMLGRLVTVRGEQSAALDAGAFRLHERLEESIRLPDDADVGRLRAVFHHGVLELHVPKLAPVSRTVRIESPVPAHLGNPDATPC